MPSTEPSPRPWRIGESALGTMSCIHDANGEHIASCFGIPTEADAALIVDAVNERYDLVENLKTANENRERENAEWVKFSTELKEERDRLRDIVRRMADTLEHVSNEHRFDFYELVREARAAIGEDAP